MTNSKARCSVCKSYHNREDMLKTGLGTLGGVCSEECMEKWKEKYRQKKVRRKVHRERKYGGRRLPGNTRDRVRRRDQSRCRWCGNDDMLQIHHVRYRSETGPDVQENLITLCFADHKRAHSNKKKYQPILLLWLWLYYVREIETTVEGAFRYASKHPDDVDVARDYSNEIMAANPRKEEAA